MQDTKSKLRDATLKCLQTRGYGGFSFHDLAAIIGIRTSSIHYHFPTKALLCLELAQAQFVEHEQALEALLPLQRKQALEAYVALFRKPLEDKRINLLCALAPEFETLPPEIADQVRKFQDTNLDWLSRVFRSSGASQARGQARLFFAAIQGALFHARVCGNIEDFDEMARTAIAFMSRSH